MSNLVFVSGDFCSGTTLLFTLFRKTGQYYCIYEPLHTLLLESLIWPMEVYEHHFFVENYYAELKGFDKIPSLFNPHWGDSRLYLPPEEEADELYRYLSYLIGTSFGRGAKVMLKENRFPFRLGWLRAKFPHAKIVHIYRKKEDQWKSIVQRVQAHFGKKDVGQENVSFNGFSIATWCEDLKSIFTQLDAKCSHTGYERFCKLWELSFAEQQRYADISIDYWALTHDFEATCERIWRCIGANGIDATSLKQFVIPGEKQKAVSIHRSGIGQRTRYWINRFGRKYAKLRVRMQERKNAQKAV